MILAYHSYGMIWFVGIKKTIDAVEKSLELRA